MPGIADTLAALGRARRSSQSTPDASRLTRHEAPSRNPGALAMHVYVPKSLAANAPLVVVLHGCTQSAEGYAEGAGWLTLADRLGFAVLCPEQTRANNLNVCFNWFQPADISRIGGEAESIAQMVRHVVKEFRLAGDRVYVTGLSAGGAMTAVMLATYPEIFAGGAVIAGLPYGSASNMQQAFFAMTNGSGTSNADLVDKVTAEAPNQRDWPTISIWHGTHDLTVSPRASEELARQWVGVHRIRDEPFEVSTAEGRRYLSWKSATGDAKVELHRIAGMGHGTPLAAGGESGCGIPGLHFPEVGISSTKEIAASWGLYAAQKSSSASKPMAGRLNIPAKHVFDPEILGPEPSEIERRGKFDVGAVINSALRAAGLMK